MNDVSNTALLPRIESRIQVIRGQRVMVDVDLAALYGVQTKRFNEQVKRNRDRFPSDFLFQHTQDGKAEVVANCDYLRLMKLTRRQWDTEDDAVLENCPSTFKKIGLLS